MHADMKKQRADEQMQGDPTNINAQNFTFRELATATKNFRQECLLSEGGFGRVYKGVIPATGQVINKAFNEFFYHSSLLFLFFSPHCFICNHYSGCSREATRSTWDRKQQGISD